MTNTIELETQTPQPARDHADSLRPRRLLVVDDCSIVREFSSRLFTSRGYEVRAVEGGYDAFLAVDGWEPDVILLDVLMPHMDGYAVCRALRMRPGSASCPILFLTGQDEAVDRIRAFSSGASDFVSKSGKPTDLVDRVEACVRAHARRVQRA